MVNKFEEEAKKILDSAPKPDAEANVIREMPEDEDKPERKKRGRKKGSVAKKKQNDDVLFEQSAKAINTLVFTLACAVTGTGEAFPDEKRAETMDKALTRYLELKDWLVSPELILFAAYGGYIKDVSTNETVKKNLSARFGFIKKINFINKIMKKFSKTPLTAEDLKEKKGWIKK